MFTARGTAHAIAEKTDLGVDSEWLLPRRRLSDPPATARRKRSGVAADHDDDRCFGLPSGSWNPPAVPDPPHLGPAQLGDDLGLVGRRALRPPVHVPGAHESIAGAAPNDLAMNQGCPGSR